MSQQLFSAFGQTRTIYTAGGVALGNMLPPTEQGFTGHRQMDALGIVHMKGRIYDPTLGRFLQADPFVQEPKNSQNYNRYSYVLNNPLRYADPSGYNFLEQIAKPFKKLGRSILKALGPKVSGWLVSIGSAWCGPYYAACVAVGNYEIARSQGASSTGAMRGAFAAGAMASVGQQANVQWGYGSWQSVATQATAGGVIADLNGGKFGHRFWAAGFNAIQQGPSSGASYG
ncbi:RHS repeat-associated core domain-containing protein [Pseudidiomarina indica]|nr:RHS repeat-associated core domain-containing protein [Pseudidiomarina indica]